MTPHCIELETSEIERQHWQFAEVHTMAWKDRARLVRDINRLRAALEAKDREFARWRRDRDAEMDELKAAIARLKALVVPI